LTFSVNEFLLNQKYIVIFIDFPKKMTVLDNPYLCVLIGFRVKTIIQHVYLLIKMNIYTAKKAPTIACKGFLFGLMRHRGFEPHLSIKKYRKTGGLRGCYLILTTRLTTTSST